MNTKYAVQTCVLSTRWKSLWISLPNLKFHFAFFDKLKSFDKFVSRTLNRRRNDLDVCAFNFNRYGTVSVYLLDKVVKYVTAHRVQTLSINIDDTRAPENLHRIFIYQPLKHLELSSVSVYREFHCFPSSLNLPNLITLHLVRVSFSKHHSTDLFSKCLNLKNLTLVDCSTKGLEVFYIIHHQLTYLTIRSSYCRRGEQNCKFVVSAPKLTSLSLTHFPPLQLCAQSLPSVEKVEIDSMGVYEYQQSIVFFSQFIDVLSELCNAKSVTLCSGAVKILSTCPYLLMNQPSQFSNWKSLKLKLSKYDIVPDYVMTYLLNCSPGVDVVTEVL